MQYRTFGKTNWRVSAVAMGGGSWMSRLGRRESERAIRLAVDLGVNLFDTAPMYGQGESEKLLGELKASQGDQVFVITKVGQVAPWYISALNPIKPMVRRVLNSLGKRSLQRVGGVVTGLTQSQLFDERSLVSSVEGSLRRLKADRLDAVQLHGPTEEVLRRGDYIPVFERLRQQGKVRFFGVSTYEQTVLEALTQIPTDLISMVQFPIVGTLPSADLSRILENLNHRGIALLGRTLFLRTQQNRGLDFKTSLHEALRKPFLDSILIGMTSAEHIKENCQACDDSVEARKAQIG